MIVPVLPRSLIGLIALLAAASIAGCGTTYITPGGGSDLARLASGNLATSFARKPRANFPAFMAVVRIQAPGYSGVGGSSRFVITGPNHDPVTSDDHLNKMRDWPEMGRVWRMAPEKIPTDADSVESLRHAAGHAAGNDADLVFIYSLDTTLARLGQPTQALPIASPFRFGPLMPADVEIASTASALIVDVRTGFVYGFSHFTAREQTSTRAWKTINDVEATRIAVEKQALDGTLRASGKRWERATMHYAGGRRVPR
ncbi:MAG: hypothetical protein ACI8TX_002203 [Hyphomicrobiaceae bacterium]|jgi:hypothetical protein